MDWHGIEWVIPVFEITMIALPIYAFAIFYRRAKQRVLTKSRALVRYASLVIAPTALFALFFFTMAGLEELAGISLISEELGRGFLLLVALGFTISAASILVLGVALVFIRQPRPASHSGRTP